MEEPTTVIESLFERTADYVETRMDLLKLKTVDKFSEAISSIVSGLALILFISFFVFLLNIGIALWIGDLLGKNYYGFLIVAGFYGLVGLIVYVFRRQWLKDPVSNLFIKKMLN